VGTRNLHRPTDICASLNHRIKIKADPSTDSSKVSTVNREVSVVDVRFIFLELMPAACAMHTFEMKAFNT